MKCTSSTQFRHFTPTTRTDNVKCRNYFELVHFVKLQELNQHMLVFSRLSHLSQIKRSRTKHKRSIYNKSNAGNVANRQLGVNIQTPLLSCRVAIRSSTQPTSTPIFTTKCTGFIMSNYSSYPSNASTTKLRTATNVGKFMAGNDDDPKCRIMHWTDQCCPQMCCFSESSEILW